MNSIFQKALILFLLVFGASACKSKKDLAQKSDLDNTNALLWEISGNGLSAPSYVFGTIHIIGANDYFLPNGTLTAIDQSKKVMFEIDMNEMNDMSNMMSLMGKAFMKDGLTLKDLLSADDYTLVQQHFQRMGLPLMFLERMKPMFLSALAYGDMDPNGLSSGSLKSYEMELMKLSQNKSLPVGGLESIEFQLGVFDEIPYKDQAKMLIETIKAGNSDNDEFKIMVDMYKRQDIRSMVQMIDSESSGMGKYEDILLSNRNKNWIPIMETNMKAQSTFFAVGAGHLAGKEGVLNLLKKAGYKLKPLSAEPNL